VATLFVRHKVNSYGTWKRMYDEVAMLRKRQGVMAASVHRDAGDPNTVVVVHRFKEMEAARRFAGSEELKAAMTKSGVNGVPEMWFGEDVEQTPF
jgi:quinol monooxygenase YgiN